MPSKKSQSLKIIIASVIGICSDEVITMGLDYEKAIRGENLLLYH